MPWHIAEEHSQCPTSRPFAVVKTDDGTVEGCHSSREEANDQLAALYASEPTLTRANGEEPNLDTPDAGDLNTAARRIAADRGWAMADGAYPIRPADNHGAADLDKAIRAVGRGGASHSAIRRHIIKRARAIGQAERIPDNWSSDGGLDGERSSTLQGEILERSDATVLTDDVDFKQRIIDIIAVPYDQEAEVRWRGEVWREVFTRSAFNGIEDHAGRVPVRREHTLGETVGRVIKLNPRYDQGLLASVRIARTPKGDETLQLASEDMLGASVGYYVKRGSDVELNRRSMLRRIKRAFLEHLAMTDVPTWVGARPVAVREGLSAQPAAGEPLVTPVLDEAMADDILSWASQRVSGK